MGATILELVKRPEYRLKNNRIGGNADEDERRSTLHNERN